MYKLLYNPLSRSKKGKKSLEEVKSYLKSDFEEINLLDIEDYKKLFDSFNEEDVIVVIGGDGTLSKFINNIGEVKQKLLFYSGGTGNDFLRNFDDVLVEYTDVDKPVFTFGNSKAKFLNGFGIGVDAEVAIKYDKKKHNNSLTYAISALSAFLTYKSSDVDITVDGTNYSFKGAWLVAVQNGKYFGAGMKVTPHAKVNDGLLDVIVVHNVNRFKLMYHFLKVYSGKHIKLEDIFFYKQGSSIEIKSSKPVFYQTDGELSQEKYTEFKVDVNER
ncbi:diacylglycerol kinase family protein [Mycoplasmatota bacterium WC44]